MWLLTLLVAGSLYTFPVPLTSERLCGEKIAEAQAAFMTSDAGSFAVPVLGWCTKLPE